MTAVVVALYALAGALGGAALIYAVRSRRRPSTPLRTGAALVLTPAAAYAAAYLTAAATSTPQNYAQAPVTAWVELVGRLGCWLGVAAAVAVVISAIKLRGAGSG